MSIVSRLGMCWWRLLGWVIHSGGLLEFGLFKLMNGLAPFVILSSSGSFFPDLFAWLQRLFTALNKG